MPAAILAVAALAWFPRLRALSVEASFSVVRAVPSLFDASWAGFGWLGPIALALLWAFRAKIARAVESFFSPLHAHTLGREWRYRLRIRWRVRRLELQLWWRRPKLALLRRHWQRPLLVLVAVVIVILLLGWAFGREAGGFFTHLSNLLTGGKDLEWRDAAQPLLVLIGLPIAFLLWWFRDIHVNETLENQRKDVNLKQFQEVQMRAAGALDEKLPARARETTQIAAIHQLRPFLTGDFGESFRRPAWELLRARLAASAEVTLTRTIAESIDRWHAERDAWERCTPEQRAGQVPPFAVSALQVELSAALAERLNPSRLSDAERAVIRDEWQTVFRSGLPLVATCFDRIELPAPALLASRDLSRCTFIGANLRRARLDGAYLWKARLDGADLRGARLDGADLQGARLDGADLRGARLDGANLWKARLDGANLGEARLDGANLGHARLDGAYLQGAQLDGANLWDARLDYRTMLERGWVLMSESDRETHRQFFRDRGADFREELGQDGEEIT